MPTETLKVLHVIARFNIGGTARYLTHLLPGLEARGLCPILVVGRVQKGEVEDSSLSSLAFLRLENLGRRVSPLSDFKSYLKLRRIIKKVRPDLIHTHTFKAGFLGRLMYFGIPKIHTYHGHLLTDPEFTKIQLKLIMIVEKFLAIFTKKIVVTGQRVGTDLLAKGVGQPKRYVSIPGESSLNNLTSREIARKNLDLTNEFTVLWLARVTSVKNPQLLVEVARQMPEVKFLMAGDGIDLNSIRAMAPLNIRILGIVDPRKILLAADIFLSTSLNEGIPYSIMEAQAAGLPVVAVKCGALSEVVADGINGYLLEPDAKAIVNKTRELQSNSELLMKFSEKSKAAATNKATEIDFVDKHVELYRNIMKGN